MCAAPFSHYGRTDQAGGWKLFADRAKIIIKSGKGGDGHVSFRREKYVAAGGPDGGDGGRGGDVIFETDPGLNTLGEYRHSRKFAAGNGEEGGKRRCHGKDGGGCGPEGSGRHGDPRGFHRTGHCRHVGGKYQAGDPAGRTRRQRKHALCHGHHAGAPNTRSRVSPPRSWRYSWS